MIREHAFNSRWWGSKVGILSDLAFFSLSSFEQAKQLGEYAWVEFVSPLDAVSPQTLARAGFAQVDTQVNFKLDLRHLPPLPDFTDLVVESADQVPFAIEADDLALFQHERFRHLPGITPARLNQRYALWSSILIAEQPQWCLRIQHASHVQGWFLSRHDENGFDLTLAALSRDATISGMLLYHKALAVYAERAQRVGGARFSVANAAVHNIYARLGARFLAPTGYWLWLRPQE